MTEQDLKDLGFDKVEHEHYYNYTKGDILSCDSDKTRNGKWYVMFNFPNSQGVISNPEILKQLIIKLNN